MAEIVKATVLGDDDGSIDAAGRSTQLPEDTWDYGKTGAKEPPYNLDALALFLEVNTSHYRCVKAKAISTAGLGFDFVVPEGAAAGMVTVGLSAAWIAGAEVKIPVQ